MKVITTFTRKILFVIGMFVCANSIADVVIVYPFDGGTHPQSFPTPSAIDSYYLPVSFSVACPGGPYKVTWSINDEVLGTAIFYDQLTSQFVYKLPVGGHYMEVETDRPGTCGSRVIKFQVVGS